MRMENLLDMKYMSNSTIETGERKHLKHCHDDTAYWQRCFTCCGNWIRGYCNKVERRVKTWQWNQYAVHKIQHFHCCLTNDSSIMARAPPIWLIHHLPILLVNINLIIAYFFICRNLLHRTSWILDSVYTTPYIPLV